MRGSDLTGQLIDRRYRIEERVSEGAMGVVYRASRLKLDRSVAIKVMHASLPAEDGKKRFEREAKLMAKLEHPHCVSIIDFGIHDSKPYVVMELIRGRDLHEILVEQGRFEPARAAEIMLQVLSGLAHAHDQGIIHRDIKPANVMVSPKAPLGVHARILDFGLARMLGASTSLSDGMAVGTPSYMSPEQCRGDQLDQRVDIYACGVVLFEMLTGKKPFRAKEPFDIIKKHLTEPPPRLADITPGDYGQLEAIVARALAKSPGDRYPTAVAMAEAIRGAVRTARGSTRDNNDSTTEIPVGSESTEVPITVGSSIRAPAHARPSRAGWMLFGALVAGGVGAGAYYYYREYLEREDEPAPIVVPPPVDAAPAPLDAPDPVHDLVTTAAELAASNKVDKAIELLVDARKVYPGRAELPALAGKLYFSKLWWNDGIANLRAAFAIDPSLKHDRTILDAVVRGYTTTPAHDGRLAQLILEIGAPIGPLLDDVAANHGNPAIRARAAAMRRRIR